LEALLRGAFPLAPGARGLCQGEALGAREGFGAGVGAGEEGCVGLFRGGLPRGVRRFFLGLFRRGVGALLCEEGMLLRGELGLFLLPALERLGRFALFGGTRLGGFGCGGLGATARPLRFGLFLLQPRGDGSARLGLVHAQGCVVRCVGAAAVAQL
jgi:hypothetical protein